MVKLISSDSNSIPKIERKQHVSKLQSTSSSSNSSSSVSIPKKASAHVSIVSSEGGSTSKSNKSQSHVRTTSPAPSHLSSTSSSSSSSSSSHPSDTKSKLKTKPKTKSKSSTETTTNTTTKVTKVTKITTLMEEQERKRLKKEKKRLKKKREREQMLFMMKQQQEGESANKKMKKHKDTTSTHTTMALTTTLTSTTQQHCVSVTSSQVQASSSSSHTHNKKANQKAMYGKWPRSQDSLPNLDPNMKQLLKSQSMEFPLNEECTSLDISPSGSLVVAGFTDGTLRLFDLTGRFGFVSKNTNKPNSNPNSDASQHDDDDDDAELEFSDNEDASRPTTNTSNVTPYNGAKHAIVCSRQHQEHGAVAAQIHAKGVHTSLIMHVNIAPDCQYAFGGVMRGSTEMVAIDISKLLNPNKNKNKKDGNNHDDKNDGDLLDWIQVWKESDAKLRGFGACTKYEHGYRLFCGRGIKNIHIWNFTPPNQENGTPMWSCIYDTQSNGNTVSFLRFRHLENGHLQAISKSDGQKLRLWDLSTTNDKNSSRPPYKDIPHTEDTIGCYGAYSFGGAYSQMNLVYLDAEDTTLLSRMEIPLPGGNGGNGGGTRRQRRGALKGISNAVGIESGSHALIELTDGTLLHYDKDKTAAPLQELPNKLYNPWSQNNNNQINSNLNGLQRKINIARIGREGMLIFAASLYNEISNRGKLILRVLDEDRTSIPDKEFWGFSEQTNVISQTNNINNNNNHNHKSPENNKVCTDIEAPMSSVKIPKSLTMNQTSPFSHDHSWSSPLSHRSTLHSSPDHANNNINAGAVSTVSRSINLSNSNNSAKPTILESSPPRIKHSKHSIVSITPTKDNNNNNNNNNNIHNKNQQHGNVPVPVSLGKTPNPNKPTPISLPAQMKFASPDSSTTTSTSNKPPLLSVSTKIKFSSSPDSHSTLSSDKLPSLQVEPNNNTNNNPKKLIISKSKPPFQDKQSETQATSILPKIVNRETITKQETAISSTLPESKSPSPSPLLSVTPHPPKASLHSGTSIVTQDETSSNSNTNPIKSQESKSKKRKVMMEELKDKKDAEKLTSQFLSQNTTMLNDNMTIKKKKCALTLTLPKPSEDVPKIKEIKANNHKSTIKSSSSSDPTNTHPPVEKAEKITKSKSTKSRTDSPAVTPVVEKTVKSKSTSKSTNDSITSTKQYGVEKTVKSSTTKKTPKQLSQNSDKGNKVKPAPKLHRTRSTENIQNEIASALCDLHKSASASASASAVSPETNHTNNNHTASSSSLNSSLNSAIKHHFQQYGALPVTSVSERLNMHRDLTLPSFPIVERPMQPSVPSPSAKVDADADNNVNSRTTTTVQAAVIRFLQQNEANHAQISTQQETDRRKLAAQHRAAHERLRAGFCKALQREQEISGRNDVERRNDLEEMIRDYEDMLEEMLNVQELEASVLAAKQRAETGRRRGVTVLEVSFPFVDMFGEARRRLGLESQP